MGCSMKYELREYVENGKSPFARGFNKLDPVTAVTYGRTA